MQSTMLPTSCDPNDGEGTMRLIEDLTTNAGEVQQRVLTEILTRNAGTEYLRGFLGGRPADRELFKEEVPIVDYEQVRPYIERLANGEPSSIISSQPISEFLISSGTSGGQPKLMPSTVEDHDRKIFLYNLLVPVMNQYVEGLDQGKGMYLMFAKPDISTPSGLVARPVMTSYYKSGHFRNRPFDRFNVYTSPYETILCPDSKQSMYCQLLCGLVQRDEVLRVGAVFASAFLRAVKFLEDHWRELCADVRAGSLAGWITDAGCRAAVLGGVLTRPDPALAGAVEAECGGAGGSWEGIIRRLWPRTKYVNVGRRRRPLLAAGDGRLLLPASFSSAAGTPSSSAALDCEKRRRRRRLLQTLMAGFVEVRRRHLAVEDNQVGDVVGVSLSLSLRQWAGLEDGRGAGGAVQWANGGDG